jgi:malonyl-CoA decarboxylase
MTTSLLQDLLSALTLRDLRMRRSREAAGQPATPDRLQAECERLLASDGEASSISLSRSVFDLYARLDDGGRLEFFRCLKDRFGPDRAAIEQAYANYRNHGDEAALQQLFDACEPPRQELLRRLNLAPGGTRELVRMREDLLRHLDTESELRTVDRDFRHLFGSWFNRGFLVLRRIDWNTSASVLEKLIQYEAVHAIRDWDDLRRRLDPRDRRCFAFFHPALGDEPLIFVEVALTAGIPDGIQQIIHADGRSAGPEAATTAAFFGISNCQYGLRGISFGSFLLKQVVQELKHELPNLQTFVTLSPVPGFRDWLQRLREGEVSEPQVSEDRLASLELLDVPGWRHSEEGLADLRDSVLPLAAWYLAEAKNSRGLPLNPVARFHLGNGARLERINWLGDVSEKGLRNGVGLMVNYVYDLSEIEHNHERLANEGIVATSASVRRLLRQAGEQKQGVRS